MIIDNFKQIDLSNAIIQITLILHSVVMYFK